MDKKCEKKIRELTEKINEADAILVGAGSGMSAAAGYTHYYEPSAEFLEHMKPWQDKYGINSTFEGFYYPWQTPQERWAFLARNVTMVLNEPVGQPYKDLYDLLKGKNYHILTTNQDEQFLKIFPEDKVSAIQGDSRYLQCSKTCSDELYDAAEFYAELDKKIDENLRVPDDQIPVCPHCGAELMPWVRHPGFLEGSKFREEYRKVQEFLARNREKKILFLEIGVGRMTPMFIQEPFWQLTYQLPDAFYITINPKDALVPEVLSPRALAIHAGIDEVLNDALKLEKEEKNHD